MAGRRRTRRAELIAFVALKSLHEHGPQTISELLDQQLCGPSWWEQMERWERAASRIAVRILIRDYQVRLDVDGRLYPPPPVRRRRVA